MSEEISWPASVTALAELQEALAARRPPPWRLPAGSFLAAGVALVSARGAPAAGAEAGVAFASAVLLEIGRATPHEIAAVAMRVTAGGPYEAGHLALREGPLLEAAIRALPQRPDVVVVHAAGRDHPRRAGLALMLGAVVEVASVGVTARPLVATGDAPPDEAGARQPLLLAGELVAYWVRTRERVRPIVAHAGWRTSPETAADLALRAHGGFRQPEPIRRAVELARRARDEASRRS